MRAIVPLAFVAAALALAVRVGAGSGSAAGPDTPKKAPERAEAIFAGGCFWCMEAPFDEIDGVDSTTSGYIGGHKENPTYEEVSSGTTGHTEAVRIVYDPGKVPFGKLLDVFWRNVDPTDAGGQFCDRGSQYRTGIFTRDGEQEKLARASKREIEASGRLPGPIVTSIEPAGRFYPAEDYHQDYYRKNPLRYSYYRYGCGRDRRLEKVWGAAPGH